MEPKGRADASAGTGRGGAEAGAGRLGLPPRLVVRAPRRRRLVAHGHDAAREGSIHRKQSDTSGGPATACCEEVLRPCLFIWGTAVARLDTHWGHRYCLRCRRKRWDAALAPTGLEARGGGGGGAGQLDVDTSCNANDRRDPRYLDVASAPQQGMNHDRPHKRPLRGGHQEPLRQRTVPCGLVAIAPSPYTRRALPPHPALLP